MNPYKEQLTEAGLELIEPYVSARTKRNIRCLICGGVFNATPISKVQNFKKNGAVGCPTCTGKAKYASERTKAIRKIETNGFEILSEDYNGSQRTTYKIRVYRPICGHEFESAPGNLIHRDVECPVCNKEAKAKRLQASHEDKLREFRETAPEWKLYRSTVTSLTRTEYAKHKATINPNNYPTGRCGIEGAYQLDHIVSVKYGFINSIPPELIAHYTNLQMLPWEDNLLKKHHLTHEIPEILQEFVK